MADIRGSSRIIIFTSIHSVRREGGGQGQLYIFFLNVVYGASILKSQNQHFHSILLGGREGHTKKRAICTLLILLTPDYAM